jgi:hypothetical protein
VKGKKGEGEKGRKGKKGERGKRAKGEKGGRGKTAKGENLGLRFQVSGFRGKQAEGTRRGRAVLAFGFGRKCRTYTESAQRPQSDFALFFHESDGERNRGECFLIGN